MCRSSTMTTSSTRVVLVGCSRRFLRGAAYSPLHAGDGYMKRQACSVKARVMSSSDQPDLYSCEEPDDESDFEINYSVVIYRCGCYAVRASRLDRA